MSLVLAALLPIGSVHATAACTSVSGFEAWYDDWIGYMNDAAAEADTWALMLAGLAAGASLLRARPGSRAVTRTEAR